MASLVEGPFPLCRHNTFFASIGLTGGSLFFPDSIVNLRISRVVHSYQHRRGGRYIIADESVIYRKQEHQGRSMVMVQLLAARMAGDKEGDVFGPLTTEMTKSIARTISIADTVSEKLSPTGQYIIKIWKQPIQQEQQQAFVLSPSDYDKLHKTISHDSMILPIIIGSAPGSWFDQNPFLNCGDARPSNENFRIEIQVYGGKEVFTLCRDRTTTFNLEDLISIWISIQNIFLDAWNIIHKLDMFITDVKAENMVLGADKMLRLIDLHFYPMPSSQVANQKIKPTIAARIDMTPRQFLKQPWISPQGLAIIGPKFTTESAEVRKLPIYHKFQAIFDATQQKASCDPLHRKKQLQGEAILFVMYPVLIWLLTLLECPHKIVITDARQQAMIDHLKAYCFDLLASRCRTIQPRQIQQFSKKWIQQARTSHGLHCG